LKFRGRAGWRAENLGKQRFTWNAARSPSSRDARNCAPRWQYRIGTPSGQSSFVTAGKNLKRETHLPIAPYFGAAFGA